MTQSIENKVTQSEVLATLEFLEELTEGHSGRATVISATILASFCQDERMAVEVINKVFQLLEEEV
jgi:hypothetical protein